MFANIIVDITHEKLDKIFQYRVPSRLAGELSVVWKFLFLRQMEPADERIRRGFSETCDYDLSKVKEIADISRDGIAIEGKLVALAAWMKEQYGGTMIQALKTVLPIKQKENAKMKKRIRLLLDKDTGKEKLDYYLGKKSESPRTASGGASG